jgi:hypothetical protein
VWKAASAIWGEREPQRQDWAHRQLDQLWEGKVKLVLAEMEQHRGTGEGVDEALSYYTTHQARMEYGEYRARGLQIGSGSVESGCKQLVGARLKQAGMIWSAEGAEEVAVVRAWLKSGRWEEAMALRPARGRSYTRQQTGGEVTARDGAIEQPTASMPAGCPAVVPVARGLSPEVLATVRAEQACEKEQHPWRTAWSVKQRRAHRTEEARPVRAA